MKQAKHPTDFVGSADFAGRHNARARWERLPPGTRLTLEEAAEIIGISRWTLAKNYAARHPVKRPPVECLILRDAAGRAWGLMRLQPLSPANAPIDHSAPGEFSEIAKAKGS